ncbi:MAG: glycosyltransferase, partial [Burkholderiaceae bacterium]
MNGDAPLASLLLIAYQQEKTVAQAVAGALSQTYTPLEIILSDDASNDGTFAAMQAAVAGYTGPHHILLNRNPRNLGIGAHLSH